MGYYYLIIDNLFGFGKNEVCLTNRIYSSLGGITCANGETLYSSSYVVQRHNFAREFFHTNVERGALLSGFGCPF